MRKKQGWKGEPYRHGMSAKGIKTTVPINQLSSEFMRGRTALSNVRRFRDGEIHVTANEKVYRAVRPLKASQLKPGMLFVGAYDKYNQGADIYEFLGFSDHEKQYGEGGPVFDTLRDVYQAYGVNSQVELEKLENERKHGFQTYMWVRDIVPDQTHDLPDSGGWFYLFEGRWSRGSGAEPLSLIEVEEVK